MPVHLLTQVIHQVGFPDRDFFRTDQAQTFDFLGCFLRIQKNAGHQLSVPYVGQGFGDKVLTVDDRLHLVGIDVLAVGTQKDIFQPPLDVQGFIVQLTQVAGAEPPVGGEHLGGPDLVLPVSGHDVRTPGLYLPYS